MTPKFRVGDMVRCTVDEAEGNTYLRSGSTGTVVGYWSDIVVSVQWDDYVGGHDCDGLAATGFGWNVLENELDFADSCNEELSDPGDIKLLFG